MKQLVQNNNSGEIELADIPIPVPKRGEVLVRTLASAVSSGTERGNLDFAKAGILEKARRRPDLVKKVINKARQEGVGTAYREAMARLDLPFPLGYSSAGVILDHGPGGGILQPGILVACSGAHGATHSEYATLPETMVAPAPPGTDPVEAAFATLGSVVLHGMRLGEVTIGGSVAFIGLGLLGLLGVQIAKAGGMRVAALDIDDSKLALAEQLGADLVLKADEDSAEAISSWSGTTDGVDSVIITATSPTNDPLILAADLARERGILVLLGNFPPDLPRRYGYDKELILRFSRAWGPGTYDPAYQERGHDEGYPPSLVRWTASRNMGAYLDLVASAGVSVKPLLTHTFDIDSSVDAYRLLEEPGEERPLAIAITYPAADEIELSALSPAERPAPETTLDSATGKTSDAVAPRMSAPAPSGRVRLGFIGAGMYATTTLVPAFASIDRVDLTGIVSASGINSWFGARRFGFRYADSDAERLIEDDSIDALVVATRHDLHAELAVKALDSGKAVWVEKPLALSLEELERVREAAARSGRALVVGYNRRFAPTTLKAVDLLQRSTGPLMIDIRVNPGPLESGHWVLDPTEGGGRLLSEGCHFFDLAACIADSRASAVEVHHVGDTEPWRQGFSAVVDFENGSRATIAYAGAGPRGFWRERVEAVGTGVAISIDNFREFSWATGNRLHKRRQFSMDKGQGALCREFVDAVASGGRLSVQDEMLETTALSLYANESLANGARISISGAS